MRYATCTHHHSQEDRSQVQLHGWLTRSMGPSAVWRACFLRDTPVRTTPRPALHRTRPAASAASTRSYTARRRQNCHAARWQQGASTPAGQSRARAGPRAADARPSPDRHSWPRSDGCLPLESRLPPWRQKVPRAQDEQPRIVTARPDPKITRHGTHKTSLPCFCYHWSSSYRPARRTSQNTPSSSRWRPGIRSALGTTCGQSNSTDCASSCCQSGCASPLESAVAVTAALLCSRICLQALGRLMTSLPGRPGGGLLAVVVEVQVRQNS